MTSKIQAYWMWASIFGLVPSIFGQLEWGQKLIEVQAAPVDASASVRFEFKNVGEKPITITSIKPSCGCTTVQLEKKSYEKGGKGEIVANFQFGERVGQQEKMIMVASDDPDEPNVILTLRVTIPELVKMDPVPVVWETGEEKTSKSVKIQVLQEGMVKFQKVSVADSKVDARLKEITAGKDYEVEITPKDTTQAFVSTVQLEGEIEGEKKVVQTKVFQIYAQVRQEVKGDGYGTALPK